MTPLQPHRTGKQNHRDDEERLADHGYLIGGPNRVPHSGQTPDTLPWRSYPQLMHSPWFPRCWKNLRSRFWSAWAMTKNATNEAHERIGRKIHHHRKHDDDNDDGNDKDKERDRRGHQRFLKGDFPRGVYDFRTGPPQ